MREINKILSESNLIAVRASFDVLSTLRGLRSFEVAVVSMPEVQVRNLVLRRTPYLNLSYPHHFFPMDWIRPRSPSPRRIPASQSR